MGEECTQPVRVPIYVLFGGGPKLQLDDNMHTLGHLEFYPCLIDEDIPSTSTFSISHGIVHDIQVLRPAASSIRHKKNIQTPIGPITRTRAKKLQLKVNLLLVELNFNLDENCLLPNTASFLALIFIKKEELEADRIGNNVGVQEFCLMAQATVGEDQREKEAGSVTTPPLEYYCMPARVLLHTPAGVLLHTNEVTLHYYQCVIA